MMFCVFEGFHRTSVSQYFCAFRLSTWTLFLSIVSFVQHKFFCSSLCSTLYATENCTLQFCWFQNSTDSLCFHTKLCSAIFRPKIRNFLAFGLLSFALWTWSEWTQRLHLFYSFQQVHFCSMLCISDPDRTMASITRWHSNNNLIHIHFL